MTEPLLATSEELRNRKALRRVVRKAGSDASVVLVGSYARGTPVEGLSDFDLLVIAPRQRDLAAPSHFQVIWMTEGELTSRVLRGDDFVQWALRWGKPLAGRGKWLQIRSQLLPDAPWPNPQPKFALARKKLGTAAELLAMGDLAAAQEEARFAFAHLARAELLKRGEYPLSRPELSSQLIQVGLDVLAERVGLLNSSLPMSRSDLAKSLEFLETCLADKTIQPTRDDGA